MGPTDPILLKFHHLATQKKDIEMTHEDLKEYRKIINDLIRVNGYPTGRLAERGEELLTYFDEVLRESPEADDSAETFGGLTREQVICCQYVLEQRLEGDSNESMSNILRLGNEAIGFLDRAIRLSAKAAQRN